LVIRDRYLVLEKYFSPEYHGREYVQVLRSATKSITSVLIGIAIEQGEIDGVQSKLLDFFPEYKNPENENSPKRNITLEQVLTMTSGIQWAEIPYSNPDNDVYRMQRSPDWIKYVLERPMAPSSGNFVYNSGGSFLLSGILQDATGKSTEEIAADHLFKTLGIKKWTWSLGTKGVSNTGWGLSMKRLDMAKMGILMLKGGRWNESQLVPGEWIQKSTKSHVKTGFLGNDIVEYEYGYQWWRFSDHDTTVSNLDVNDVYFAWGYGGQFIFVIPHLDMVVVSTGDNYGADYRLFFDLLRDHIFPAVLD
jgi:CubicO group peptidase (beta-lactamase class C family)